MLLPGVEKPSLAWPFGRGGWGESDSLIKIQYIGCIAFIELDAMYMCTYLVRVVSDLLPIDLEYLQPLYNTLAWSD